MSNEAPRPDQKPKPHPDPLVDTKTTVAAEMPGVLSARRAAELWGNWSDDAPRTGRKYRPRYSIR